MQQGFDLIISGRVLTLTTANPQAEAVGIKGGRIAAVGALKELRRASGGDAAHLDLSGTTILPGFIDTHTHPIGVGTVAQNVDLGRADTVGEALAALGERARLIPAGETVLAFNYNVDRMRERRLPSLAELDGAVPSHPAAVILYDIHSAQLNSRMLAELELPPGTEGMVKDASGRLTGRVEDPAIAVLIRRIQPTEPDRVGEAIAAAARQALRLGITTLHTKEPPAGLRQIGSIADALAVRVKPMMMIKPQDVPDYGDLLASKDAARGAVVALYADGAPDSRTAAYFEPYPGDPANFGMLYYEDAQMEDLVTRAHLAGRQVSVHACGTRAVEQVLQVYEKVISRHPRNDHRHRIEHFEMPFKDQIRRAVRAGIGLAVQPAFLFLSGAATFENMRALLGEERTMRWTPLRSILDAGGMVAGGSDAPVTPMGPLAGIQACVCHPNPDERITRCEALQLFTRNGAWIGFEENDKGSVEAGKLADFAVLAENPFAVGRERIGGIPVVMTIVGGKVAYRA